MCYGTAGLKDARDERIQHRIKAGRCAAFFDLLKFLWDVNETQTQNKKVKCFGSWSCVGAPLLALFIYISWDHH